MTTEEELRADLEIERAAVASHAAEIARLRMRIGHLERELTEARELVRAREGAR